MRQILFSDLDGTLLSDDKSVSEANRKAIQRLLREGDYFVICTGRPVYSGRVVARELGLTTPGCYMICFNGAVIYDCSSDRILKQYSVPIEDTLRLFEEAKKMDLYIQTYNSRDIITLEHTKELNYYISKASMPYKVVSNLQKALIDEPQKSLLIDLDNTGKLQEFQEKNRKWADEKMTSFFSCNEYLEYCPKGIDKGTGVKYLAQFLDVPLENTIAIGDERNDISMLEAAHIGIAMKNSQEDVFAHADAVTERNNNQSAIEEIVDKYFFHQQNLFGN